MKNKKLNLSELKVKSFVTDFEKEASQTAKGGGTVGSAACSVFTCDTSVNSILACITDFCGEITK